VLTKNNYRFKRILPIPDLGAIAGGARNARCIRALCGCLRGSKPSRRDRGTHWKGSKLTRPTITAWDCFRPRARPRRDHPWRALAEAEDFLTALTGTLNAFELHRLSILDRLQPRPKNKFADLTTVNAYVF
jgi:hypothetical protein